MKTNFDRRKSLRELEGDDWGEPNFKSSLVETCHRLRRVPLADFRTEDLRIMIGQKIGLFFLVPIALEKLEDDPMAEGHSYSGDLLNAVLGVPATFWSVHTDKREVLRRIVAKTKEVLALLEDDEARLIREKLATWPEIE